MASTASLKRNKYNYASPNSSAKSDKEEPQRSAPGKGNGIPSTPAAPGKGNKPQTMASTPGAPGKSSKPVEAKAAPKATTPPPKPKIRPTVSGSPPRADSNGGVLPASKPGFSKGPASGSMSYKPSAPQTRSQRDDLAMNSRKKK